MARASLCFLIAMILPACLVTSTPSSEERKRTPPFLLAETAIPDPRLFKIIDLTTTPFVDFQAGVVSEDADAKVLGHLVLDYGFKVEGGYATPFFLEIGRPATVEPATLDDPPRTLAVRWSFGSYKPTPGCHNVALFATHEFDDVTGCAADPSDFDYVLWTILVCDSSQGTCCDPAAPPDQGGCSVQCPDFDTDVRCGKSAGDSP